MNSSIDSILQQMSNIEKGMCAASRSFKSEPLSSFAQISKYELTLLSNPEGITIDSISDIEFNDHGLFTYKGELVVLYIRDRNPGSVWPKYHLTSCRTIREMETYNRKERYVIRHITEEDGDNPTFVSNTISSYRNVTPERLQLDVCKNCLKELHLQGVETFQSFSIQTFFNRFRDKHSLHNILPSYNDVSSPLNAYSKNWDQISLKLREYSNWTCSQCNALLTDERLRKYLHVHHVDGCKNNTVLSNLRVLCVECHNDQPKHGHMQPQVNKYHLAKNEIKESNILQY